MPQSPSHDQSYHQTSKSRGRNILGQFDPLDLVVIGAALALGGFLKGATGAGTPIVAVPVIAAFLDVKAAVALLALPNFCTNVLQVYAYRRHVIEKEWLLRFVVSGGIGAGLGTLVLHAASDTLLSLFLAAVIAVYVPMRLALPELKFPQQPLRKAVWPVGLVGGLLQGAAGISAPVTLSYLNAMGLQRGTFIFTLSAFFTGMSVVQIATLWLTGAFVTEIAIASLVAMIPLFLAMPLGAWATRSMSAKGFDRMVLVLLTLLALRLIYGAIFL